MAQEKLYHTLHDQITHQHYPGALRTVSKLLRIDPNDPLALQTRSQLLIALDKYADALRESASGGTSRLARAYCLYKLGRVDEAREQLDALEEEDEGAGEEERRAREVLRAQLLYRLGDFEQARDLFDDLAATAEQDSPELPDLQSNLSASISQLDFLSSVPSLISSTSSLSIEDLESRPLSLVLPSDSIRTHTAPSRPTSSTRPRPPRGSFSMTPTRLSRAPPPSDRWIPIRQRPSMRDALMQQKEKQRGKKRERHLASQGTQGAIGEDEGRGKVQTGGGQRAGGGGEGKKKKGKK
ncbi:CDP-diacylglycerol-glycerol-3-phosphate 3-phosphatidyltransferase [Rhodotorula toruloides]|uniref:CDP-diacylglycerol-glycerol-3-phosphate 3-phosphatidyltransferase n=1 Tax=Rhodotorula toruloides TaxID=5286 RepID=A0A511KQL5_RHOTO|nr:CDP-diacylglycerol-glycerol-3-phosphate 3-phosphatidyltransferase [Rhodotorula toruloides]